MRIGTLSKAMHQAVIGINKTSREVEETAENVSSGIENEAGETSKNVSQSLAEIPVKRQRVAANVQVIDTAKSLLNELASKPRR